MPMYASKKVKLVRKHFKIKQQYLAYKLNKTQQSYSKFEKQISEDSSIDLIKETSLVLGVDYIFLLADALPYNENFIETFSKYKVSDIVNMALHSKKIISLN